MTNLAAWERHKRARANANQVAALISIVCRQESLSGHTFALALALSPDPFLKAQYFSAVNVARSQTLSMSMLLLLLLLLLRNSGVLLLLLFLVLLLDDFRLFNSNHSSSRSQSELSLTLQHRITVSCKRKNNSERLHWAYTAPYRLSNTSLSIWEASQESCSCCSSVAHNN